ncbi:hypothetical protein L1D11_09170 [Vibrio sp. Isolate32]|uniref:hypothetical protein n=2 Tax=unclassified Vibrio TaxID=2614977 RepID=UPI001EFD1082|nr:hypothetical protein [Vibrio sp. Isolate32]MCG9553547.1 hypothetical protein [Vibrio sp. Isolate32]
MLEHNVINPSDGVFDEVSNCAYLNTAIACRFYDIEPEFILGSVQGLNTYNIEGIYEKYLSGILNGLVDPRKIKKTEFKTDAFSSSKEIYKFISTFGGSELISFSIPLNNVFYRDDFLNRNPNSYDYRHNSLMMLGSGKNIEILDGTPTAIYPKGVSITLSNFKESIVSSGIYAIYMLNIGEALSSLKDISNCVLINHCRQILLSEFNEYLGGQHRTMDYVSSVLSGSSMKLKSEMFSAEANIFDFIKMQRYYFYIFLSRYFVTKEQELEIMHICRRLNQEYILAKMLSTRMYLSTSVDYYIKMERKVENVISKINNMERSLVVYLLSNKIRNRVLLT